MFACKHCDVMPRPAAAKVASPAGYAAYLKYMGAPKKAPAKKRRVTTTRRRVNESNVSVARRSVRRGGTSDLGSMLGGLAGMALGGPTGAMIGNAVGGVGGNMLSRIFGSGDYQVSNAGSLKKNNIALANASNIPQFGTGKVASKFVHREFLGDVISSATAGAFKIDSYAINPGQPGTFPWLAGVVGSKYQQYRINGMTFEFRSMSSDALNSTNTALGSVIMSTDYDSADTTFSSKQQMENTENGVSCKPSVNMMHGIECQRSQTPVSELFIRAYDVPSGKDIRFYDLGRFSIASTGMQGTNVNLGELWVTYDIDCFKAIEQVPGYLIPYAQYQLNVASATAPLGTSQTIYPVTGGADTIGLTLTENKISFPADIQRGSRWHVQVAYQASEAKAITVPAVTVGGGMYVGIQTPWKSPASAVTTAVFVLSYYIEYQGGATVAAPPYINLADFTWAVASVLQGDLYVSQVSGDFGGTYTGTSVPAILSDDAEDPETDSPVYVCSEEQKKPQTNRRIVR